MKKVSLFNPALVALSLAGLLTACQTAPSHPDAAGAMASRDGKHRMHRPHQHDRHPMKGWRNPEVRAQLQQACAGKASGQEITIKLQNGKTLQGRCELRFKPNSPRAATQP